jgi:hypothetical protein
MNNRNARRLLLVVPVLFALPAAALAQRGPGRIDRLTPFPGSKESHLPLDEGPTDSLEASMADRLRQLRESREMQQLAQRLLSNPDFLKDIKDKLSQEELQRLRAKVEKGEGIGGDDTWKRFLDKVREHESVDQAEKLKRWAESTKPVDPPQPINPGTPPAPIPNGPGAVSPPAPVVPPPEKPRSPWGELKEKSTSWLRERMTDLPDRVGNVLDNVGEGALADHVRETLRSLARGGMDEEGLPMSLQEAFRDLAGKLSNLGDYVPSESVPWQEIRSLFQEIPRPSLPDIEPPAVSFGGPSAGGDGFEMAWLWLAVLVVLGLILYKSTVARRSAAEGAGGWRLGPWPVAPGAVATRGDLVAAFEYLAFLRLGPAARVLNHLDVADELGEQAPDSGDRRRAADELARLYEQARYAPEEEPLTEEDLASARRDLCMLAGVAFA